MEPTQEVRAIGNHALVGALAEGHTLAIRHRRSAPLGIHSRFSDTGPLHLLRFENPEVVYRIRVGHNVTQATANPIAIPINSKPHGIGNANVRPVAR